MRTVHSALIGLVVTSAGTLVGGILLFVYGAKLSDVVTELLPFVGQFVKDNQLAIALLLFLTPTTALNIYFITKMIKRWLDQLNKQSKLKSLAKEVAELGQHLNARHWYESHLPSPNTSFDCYLNQLSEEMKNLSDKLSELSIESPEIIEAAEQDEGLQIEQLNTWNTYLAILLPLAASGRIHDSQQVVWRSKGEEAPVEWGFTFSIRPR